MNIIYLLENKTKTEGRRFYIGSKQECSIEEIDGVNRIVSLKTGMPYYGSATCVEMKQDMADLHTFHATLLESIPDKKNLLDAENKWIKMKDAVNSPEFYNKGYAVVGIHGVDQYAMFNVYGETIVGYGKITSSINKRNNTAKKYGFKNAGEFSVWLYLQFQLGYNSAQIASKIGWERHAPSRYIKDYDMSKCISEYAPGNIEQQENVRRLVAKGASVKKISEIYNLQIPTVLMYIGDYNSVKNRSFTVAARKGMTKEELEIEVTKKILKGGGFLGVAQELGLNETSCKRYFMRCVRKHLKPENLRKD